MSNFFNINFYFNKTMKSGSHGVVERARVRLVILLVVITNLCEQLLKLESYMTLKTPIVITPTCQSDNDRLSRELYFINLSRFLLCHDYWQVTLQHHYFVRNERWTWTSVVNKQVVWHAHYKYFSHSIYNFVWTCLNNDLVLMNHQYFQVKNEFFLEMF